MMWGKRKYRNIAIILLSCVAYIFSVFLIFLAEIASISFKSMILYKGYRFKIPFVDKLSALIKQIAISIDMQFIFDIFYLPLRRIIIFFASIKFDFGSIAVTCAGAASPLSIPT